MAYRFSERATDDIYWMYERGKARFGERAAENYYLQMLGSHLIVYRLDDPDIEILRVLHQLQDWQGPR